MIVFPESLNKLDASDTEKSIQMLENYINYMCERVDHAVTNMTTNLAAQGDLGPFTLERLDEMMAIVSQMSSTVSAMRGEVNALNNSVESLTGTVGGITTKIAGIESTLTEINSALDSLDERVKKLEGGTK